MSGRGIAIRVIAAAVVVAGVAVLLARTDLDKIGDAFARAHVAPLAVVAVINFGILVTKAKAWQILLAPAHRVGLRQLTHYTLLAYAASVVLPFRSGELVRLWMLRDRDGVPVSRSAAVAIAEKLLDIVSMLVIVAPLPFLLPGTGITWWIGGLAAGTIVALVIVGLLAPRLGTTGWRGELAGGLAVLRDPRRLLAALAILIAGWLIDGAMVALVLAALDLPVHLGTCSIVLFAMNLTIALPSTPASVGALEIGAVAGLGLVGIGEADAFAFGVLYHVIQVVPVAVIGLASGALRLARPGSIMKAEPPA